MELSEWVEEELVSDEKMAEAEKIKAHRTYRALLFRSKWSKLTVAEVQAAVFTATATKSVVSWPAIGQMVKKIWPVGSTPSQIIETAEAMSADEKRLARRIYLCLVQKI